MVSLDHNAHMLYFCAIIKINLHCLSFANIEMVGAVEIPQDKDAFSYILC